MRLKLHELPIHLQNQVAATFYPKAGLKYAHIEDRCRPPDPLLERHLPNEPLAADQAKDPNPARYSVRVTSYRRRLLDEDNLAEKFHIDALRYAGILPSDAPERCEIITKQEKVRTKAEEKTVIEITLP
jgi:hypothetical protein